MKFTLLKTFAVLSVFIGTQLSAQPDYSFKNPTLLSGTALKAGAVYKYSNVKTGVDAIMTIGFISPGIKVSELDGSSGYSEAIQPTLNADPWTTGYLEMNIQFVKSGTSTPLVQAQVSVTCIDVDGVPNFDGKGHNLYEYDEINIGGGYADFKTAGGEVSVSQSGDWFNGTNIGAVDYPGRDTSAKAVMFSVINVNVSAMIIRVGVINQTANNASRQRSVYFKKFDYQNVVLAIADKKSVVRHERKSTVSSFSVQPNIVNSSATMVINASEDGWAILELVDYSGNRISQQRIMVEKGMNRVPLFNLSSVARGNYLAVLKLDGRVFNQKIVKM